ncbi:TetR/AcrR family transcriptional regulator [Rhizobium sp. GR12]|uniref:TetR/AcrR family transcriptional regulator n=1 Tax=Rhizobium sp. GR12 TaxID=3053925 RepID=UPI002FBEF03A
MAGRPREFDRHAALAKARDAFWSRGYEGVSMADLVETLGIASARIYAAFGSKETLFLEAVALYDEGEGGFATRALAEEPTAMRAIERSLREAVETYTQKGRPQGCMVVSAATNCAAENDNVREFLADYRRRRTASLVERLKRAVAEGELRSDTDAQMLGDHYATVLHGFSVQARDGVSRTRLLATIPTAMLAIQTVSIAQRSQA